MRKILAAIITVIIFLLGFFYWGILPREPSSNKTIIFAVQKGEGDEEISANLEKEGIIKNRYFFQMYVLTQGKTTKLQAGKYELSPRMNIPEIVNKFVLGDVLKEKITIIEGWNLRDIGWYFENKGMFMTEEFFEIAGFPLIDYSKNTDLPFPKDYSQQFEFLADKPKNVGLEGYLFPDTYEISAQDDIEKIIKRILANFDKKLTPDLKKEIIAQKKTIFEIITMASLLEKEVKTLEDKKIVSGIFWKRIKSSKPLQSCATINYITGKNDRGALLEDIEIDSPYNTYKYYGLPLGPISNPGLDSILAAIYPTETNYLYYLSTPDGKTIFSKTFKEHSAAQSKYLK